jgi:hypothetical protein
MYPYMAMEEYWVDEVEFTYLLYIKSSIPYIIKYTYTYKKEELEAELEAIMKKYVEQDITQEREAKENMRCRACNLRKLGKCPLYQNNVL